MRTSLSRLTALLCGLLLSAAAMAEEAVLNVYNWSDYIDVVVPSSTFMSKQIEAGVYMKLDKSKLPNLANLDPVLMKIIASMDPKTCMACPMPGGLLAWVSMSPSCKKCWARTRCWTVGS